MISVRAGWQRNAGSCTRTDPGQADGAPAIVLAGMVAGAAVAPRSVGRRRRPGGSGLRLGRPFGRRRGRHPAAIGRRGWRLRAGAVGLDLDGAAHLLYDGVLAGRPLVPPAGLDRNLHVRHRRRLRSQICRQIECSVMKAISIVDLLTTGMCAELDCSR